MDNIRQGLASINCKNIFKNNNEDNKSRKENLTRKMAELINEQERAKKIYTTNDD